MNIEKFKQEVFNEQLQYIIEFYGDDINVECLRNIMYITLINRLLNKDMEYVIHKGKDFWAKLILEQYNKIKEEDQLWFWTAGEKEADECIKKNELGFYVFSDGVRKALTDEGEYDEEEKE